jgi:putative ABC transport system permease protein
LYSFFENIRVALSAVRMNVVRAILTIFIIAFGIMALISMLTAVDGIQNALMANFASIGSNTFTITNQSDEGNFHGRGRQPKPKPIITYDQAKSFRDNFKFPAVISLAFSPAQQSAIVEYLSTKTSPKITVSGADQNFLLTAGMKLAEGRNFTLHDIRSASRTAIIGYSLKDELFGPQEAIGHSIRVNGVSYIVIGYLQEKGSMFGQSQDEIVIIPISSAQNQFSTTDVSYDLTVQVNDITQLDQGVYEATGFFRTVRKLDLAEEDNFTIVKSDSIAQTLMQNVSFLRIIAFGIGIITLLGAAVGLTNIMLVSVTERTREIGVRKAIGATTKKIRNQFLWEALVITQLGGLVGIAAGIGLGNIVTSYFGGAFIIPWNWIIWGVIICIIVGIFAGLYPAVKAAKLDPVESLRHE